MQKITQKKIDDFEKYLYEQEKTVHTVKKYIADVKKLWRFAGNEKIKKK